jgi:hypothetical protein
MKVNLKKIGAIVAGATILASSAAFAGLMFGSTTLVDTNGAPVAKVVIGSKAHPSDGVAGGLIAGKMVSETYKSSKLTAQVSGTAACKAANATNATGTCTISNEKAKLEITVPGALAAGTWTGSNLIGDFLNKELLDREYNNAGDNDAEYEMGGSDTSDDANPFTDGAGSTIGESNSFLYKIDGKAFTPFKDYSMKDADTGNTYVEYQALWLEGDNRFDTDPDDVVGRLDFLAYSLKFDGPGGDEIGIPVCTESEDNDYTFCKGADGDIDDATETHRVKLMFLGEEWIISEMEAPNNDPDPTLAADGLTSESRLVNGGSVKLAKESIAGILNQGESLPVDGLKFQLDDLEAHGDVTSAIISVLDANGNVLDKDKVDPGNTKEFNIKGKTYRFHVYKVAPGYTFGAKWADVAIFSQELELEDGQELDSDEDSNPDYEVSLGWKNLDASSGVAIVDGGNPETADALRTIVIYSTSVDELSTSGEEELEEGDSVSIVQDPVAWKLSYKGLDITSDDRHSLKFQIKTTDKDISASKGPDTDNDGDTDYCEIYAPYVEVTSGDTGSVFEVERTDSTAAGTDLSDDEFIVALNVGAPTNDAARCDDDVPGDSDVTTTSYVALPAGTVFMKLSPSSSNYGYSEYGSFTDPGTVVGYEDIGDGDNEYAPPEGGAILIESNADVAFGGDDQLGDLLDSAYGTSLCTTGNCPDFWFSIAEKAGTGSSNDFVDYWTFGIADTDTGTPGDATFDFDSSDGTNSWTSDDDEVLYGHATPNPPGADEFYDPSGEITGPVTSDLEMVEEEYVSERGSKFESIDKTRVEFDMTHKLAKAQWFLASAKTSTNDTSKTIATLGEGESVTVSGVTVKVLEITETVGACSAAGGAASCTADMTGVSAVIMPNNAASVTVAMPYNYSKYGNLVILDSDAVGINTLVSVGGDKVNSITASLLQGSAVDWTATEKVVKEVVQGSKIVVAGKDKDDTLAAAKDFVSQLKKI